MQRLPISLRWKVMGLILGLISIMILVIGLIVEDQQTDLLEKGLFDTANREAQSIVYIDSRAMIVDDDLVILDSLKNLNSLEGFIFARVVEAKNKSTIVASYKIKDEKEKENLVPLWDKLLDPKWKKVSYKTSSQIIFDRVPYLNKEGIDILAFHLPIYHPFSAKKDILLGIVQVAFSDEFIKQKIASNRLALILLGGAFWLIGILASLFMTYLIVKPIRILSQGAKTVGEGDLEHQLPDLGEDELGKLAKQFNSMTQGLKVAEKAKADTLIFNEQLKQAQEIQEGMNPMHFLQKDKYQVQGYTRAAKGVGGDYFDFHEMADGKIGVLISDVSGKSISASLVMVIIKTVVSTYFKIFKKIRSDLITKTINRVMCGETHIDKFATFLFVIYDPITSSIEFTNGGHGPLFIYRAKDKVCTLSKLPGLPMGIDDDSEYNLAKMKLHTGDMIVFFTDGINEARNPKKEEYGNIRLSNKIVELADHDPKNIVDDIVQDLDNFMDGAEQHDDMTLVIMKAN